MGKNKNKKKNKAIILPWCWYCEREFEDEKVLMQHQKAKHFKCGMCPRRLNTAGGLAVHIQQVHKLEPENLPRIDNALPGRDGYEVEIFGMEGIPAPDVADYKRRKEIELGLPAGSVSQPPQKKPRTEHRILTDEELRTQLEAHKALMGAAEGAPAPAPDASTGGVYNAAPQTYAAPPTSAAPPSAISPPPPGGGIPPFVPPGMAGFPPGPPPPGFPGMPPPGMFQGGMPPFLPPPGMMPPFAPGGSMPPFPPPPGMMGAPPFAPGGPGGPGGLGAPPPTFVPSSTNAQPPPSGTPAAAAGGGLPPLAVPATGTRQTNPAFKKPTELKWADANFSPEEVRARHPKYEVKSGDDTPTGEDGPRGTKRARAEDFL